MYPAALAFIAISRAESHSMTLLEAWTLGVLSFKDKCEVMRYQVERCSGWLHYASQLIYTDAAGKAFVRCRYN